MSAMKGDLDSVVMKAIEKDRCRRYETVNGLIMDLQRYNAHQPVLARPQRRVYLFGKFVRRNRLVVVAAAATVLSLLVGLGAASTHYLREKKAREEQFRLRQRAETAHRNELRRLSEAQQWESFAHVSVLLSEGKTGEADEQLRRTPLTLIKLTPQSSVVLRSLGNWNALRGRWDQAAECFRALRKADELNHSEHLIDSLDLMAIGCVLIETGRPQDYQAFCNWAQDRFGNSTSPSEMSRLFHSVLLLPADKQMLAKLDKLKPLREFKPIRPEIRQEAVWRAFGLALLEYRLGNYEKSLYWADRGSAKHRLSHIIGSFEPVRAMANHRLGNVQAAESDLASCRIRIEKAFSPELPAAYEPFGKNQGFWWDWIIVRILFREAEALMEKG